MKHQKSPNPLVVLTALLVLALPLSGWAQFNYTTNNGAITITGYTGSGGPSYTSLNGVLFNKTLTTHIQYPQGLAGAYTIPGSVTSIGDSAFASSGLTSVTNPVGVTSIGHSAYEYSPLTRSQGFQFTISWGTNTSVVVVEASTNLHDWTPVSTNTLVNGTSAFVDSAWTNYPHRFYRLRSE